MENFGNARMWIQSILMDKDGNTLQVGEWVGNLPLNKGKLDLAYLITGGATACTGAYIYVCAGSGASATPTVSVSDDRLGGTLASHASAHEYIANGTRKVLLSTLVTSPTTVVSSSDWQASTVTVGSITYTQVLNGYVTYGPGDANGTVSGVPFRRYGLNNLAACPVSATGLSGTMLNEVVDTTTNLVTDTNILRVNVSLRI